MEAISAGAKTIINYGTAGAVGNLSGLIEPTGFVDRDMDVRPLGFELGQTPFEEGIRIGHRGIIVGSGVVSTKSVCYFTSIIPYF